MAFWIYLLILAVSSVIGDRGLLASYTLWKERKKMEHDMVSLQSDVNQLRQNVFLFRTDRRTVERYAREELHLAGENEIQYIFP